MLLSVVNTLRTYDKKNNLLASYWQIYYDAVQLKGLSGVYFLLSIKTCHLSAEGTNEFGPQDATKIVVLIRLIY